MTAALASGREERKHPGHGRGRVPDRVQLDRQPHRGFGALEPRCIRGGPAAITTATTWAAAWSDTGDRSPT